MRDYMNKKLRFEIKMSDISDLTLPRGTLSLCGLRSSAKTQIEKEANAIRFQESTNHLAKIYIEPTNRCNLDCITCIRNVWNEPLGLMTSATFGRIMEGLRSFSPPPSIFFGGLGEPLLHPDIVEMVARAKALGSSVELITNGTLLTPNLSQHLIDAGLDMLWASLDGATSDSYADVRLGAMLPKVLSNLNEFQYIRLSRNSRGNCMGCEGYNPQLGIVFVAMKRNIRELPALLNLANRLAVSRFMVTNVLPYTFDMCKEVLYSNALVCTSSLIQLEMPRIDVNDVTEGPLRDATKLGCNVVLSGVNHLTATNHCPFIEKDATAINWEGNLSPCLPLMHSYTSFVDEREHFRRRYTVGTLGELDLKRLWNEPEYVLFRERVKMFDFPPCTSCSGCDLSESNETDCFGSPFPTCGNCLWAHGLVQCP